MYRVGLGWVGLGWVGLGWVGLGWVGLGWVGLGWVGLGWVLVKRIAELHGGQVTVNRDEGKSSCFAVELPCISAASSSDLSESLINPTLEETSTTSEIEQLTTEPLILLAEDNEANILIPSSYLQAKGYRIQVAKNGAVAINLAQAEPPHVILMDIHMPGIDGLTAIQHIRQLPDLADIPIIALTALAMKGDQERCLDVGADLYLGKPVKFKQLNLSIPKLLSR